MNTRAEVLRFTFQRSGDGPEDKWVVSYQDRAIGTVTIGRPLPETVFEDWNGKPDGRDGDRLRSNEMWEALFTTRDRCHRDEQLTGSFIVKFGTELARFHTYQRAHAYAAARLELAWRHGIQGQHEAAFWRDGQETPFCYLSVNEYGHDRIGRAEVRP